MKKELERRPAVWLALAFIAGLSAKAALWPILIVPALFVLVSAGRKWLFLVLAALLGLLIGPDRTVPLADPIPYDGPAEVVTVPAIAPSGTQALIRIPEGLIRLQMGPDADISLKDQIHVKGRLSPIRRGGESWATRGVIGSLHPTEFQMLGTGPGIFRLGREARSSFRRFSQEAIGRDRAAMVDALCFNVDAMLDPDLKTNLKRVGAIHIISASGLHVIVLLVVGEWLLRLLPIPRPWQLLILLCLLVPYAGAAGLRPPIVRSIVMAAIGLFAYVFRRESDTLSSLGLSAIFQCLWDPFSPFDIGFQLSYVIVGGLALYPTYFEVVGVWWFRLVSSVWTSWVATAAALPLVAFYFGMVPLVAIPANLLIGPVVAPLVAGSLVAWLIGLVFPALGAWLLQGISVLATWIDWVAYALARWDWAAIPIRDFPSWGVPLFYVACLLLWRRRRRPERYVDTG